MSRSHALDADTIKRHAAGHWVDLLAGLGDIDARLLDGRNHSCPKCGGTDRFALVDAERGAVHCRKCFSAKNGDGLAALQWLTGLSFPEVLALVAEDLGLNQSASVSPTPATESSSPARSRSRRTTRG